MSKRKGPVLITELLPKIAKQTNSRTNMGTQVTPGLESAKSAYQFISESYKITPAVKNEFIKTVSKVEANNKQTISKVEANNKQTVSSHDVATLFDGLVRLETVSATVSKGEANNKQTVSKVVANQPISALVGLQRSILLLIFNECQLCRGEVSPPLSLEHIASHCGSTVKTVKNAIYRLTKKNFLSRAHYKDGRGGWTQYRLSKLVFQDILHHETVSKVVANRKQSGSATVSATVSSPPSSSSFLDSKVFKTTTTSEPELFEDGRFQLSPEWAVIDISPLTEIGFTQNHLIQLAKHSKLTASEVASSIEFFAFDLRRNAKAKAINVSPLNFFMGIVRKGIPYAPAENYESPADEARRRTREIMEIKERDRDAEDRRIFDLAFLEWKRELAPNDLLSLVPEWAKHPGQMQDSALKSYFEANVWKERAQGIFGLAKLDRTEIGKQVDQEIGEATR